MPINNAEHTALIKAACEALAIAGYCVWPINTGALKTATGGFVRFGKKGGGDITGILPVMWHEKLFGVHLELEGKTGDAVQNKNQKIHQKFVVEKNGGIYIVFHSVEESIESMAAVKEYYHSLS